MCKENETNISENMVDNLLEEFTQNSSCKDFVLPEPEVLYLIDEPVEFDYQVQRNKTKN